MNITLVDHQGATWSLDEKLYKGGFGTIYSCLNNSDVVIKTQPKSDDQLRKEECFYYDLRCTESSKYIPNIVTSGIANDLRFIVINRFPFDLHRFIQNINISKQTRCTMATQLLSALQFIHSFGYSHGDLKAHNVLVKSDGADISLYITDFGLVHRFDNDGSHVPYIPGKLSKHRGTLPFISEDSHIGVIPSRRSDLENMGWLLISSVFRGVLPWLKLNKSKVLKSKQDAKRTIEQSLKDMMQGQSHKRILKYMRIVISMKYEESPDYEVLKEVFEVLC